MSPEPEPDLAEPDLAEPEPEPEPDLAEAEPEPGLAEPEPERALTEEEKEELNDALCEAARAGNAEAVRRCLQDGADPNAADGFEMTALYYAAQMNQVGCMEALVEAGVDVDKADGLGWTPLMVAAMEGHTAAVEWLLGRGADWRLTLKNGNTVLDFAKEYGEAEAAAALEAWIAKEEMLTAALAAAREDKELPPGLLLQLPGRPTLGT